jgi:PIN domain nuclease of toxin-antitoxin system
MKSSTSVTGIGACIACRGIMPRIVPMLGFEWLDIEPADAFDAARLNGQHRDPWDRIIATQAERRRLDLITADGPLISACLDWRVQTVW